MIKMEWWIEVGDFKIPTDRHGRSIVNFRGGKNLSNISQLLIFSKIT